MNKIYNEMKRRVRNRVVIALFFYYSTILLIVFSTALFLNKKSESVYNDFDCDIIKAI